MWNRFSFFYHRFFLISSDSRTFLQSSNFPSSISTLASYRCSKSCFCLRILCFRPCLFVLLISSWVSFCARSAISILVFFFTSFPVSTSIHLFTSVWLIWVVFLLILVVWLRVDAKGSFCLRLIGYIFLRSSTMFYKGLAAIWYVFESWYNCALHVDNLCCCLWC